MNLIACKNCGVVLDQDILKFDEREDGDVVPHTAEWDGEEYLPTTECPMCNFRIVKGG